jgi:two-component system, NtrC family, nitrogen regulation response regulator NtrX
MTADILIVDDESDIRDLVSEILKDEQYSARSAKDSDSALKALGERVPALLILDIWLQGSELDGLGILEIVQKKYPQMPVVMISGHGNIETAVTATKMGAYDFIEKPFQAERLLSVTRRALEHAKLRYENSELKLRGAAESQLIGTSYSINQVQQSVEKVAPTHSRVMITGPAGSGKEVVARLIHAKSRRSNGAFVVLNAASMTPDRVDVELFGIEDSNPGGGAEKVGVFERAHGGTLFIDEVVDMPLETQGRILRVLQEQAFERVHGHKKVVVDVRVIAASNRELTSEIDAGRFREDLYYRLNVVPIKMPALRERREDIPDLCRYFLRRASEISGLGPRELTEEAIAALQSYHWPGNVRHLRNMMEWLLIMSPGGPRAPIKSEMLPKELLEANPVATRPEVNSDIMSMPLREARELFEKQYLMAQITRFGGNISKTSSFVGMERSALHRKLKLLGIGSGEEKEDKVA